MSALLRLLAIACVAWCTASWTLALLSLVTNLAIFHRRSTWLLLRTLRRDVDAFRRFPRVLFFMRACQRRNDTVVSMFARSVQSHPDKTMFVFGGGDQRRSWSFADADRVTNQVANFFASRGLAAGDDVVLVMSNRPETVFLWLGLAKIGVASALVNHHLRKDSLWHSISAISGARAVICEPDMVPALLEVVGPDRSRTPTAMGDADGARQPDDLRRDSAPAASAGLADLASFTFFCYGSHERLDALRAEDVSELIAASPCEPRKPNFEAKISDPLIYVFTSGTTGLPKAAIIKHYRFIVAGAVGRFLAGITSDDILYSYLPFYHMAGGVFATSQTVVFGTTAVIAPKFSASRFWSECAKYGCTVTQYIGEVCRYLQMQPPSREDRQHSIRLMLGNGLRPAIWGEFVERFGIADIKEIYGSTEGNANLMNLDRTVGNVGFIPTVCQLCPAIAALLWNRYLIKIDPETGKPLRGPDGLCIVCGPNEPGEFVGVINNQRPETAFDGYTDKESTSTKIYRNVVRHGDSCFATGDILDYDEDGYYHFRDRTGDSFRWKSENVSTAEVENAITKYAVDKTCVVFGVPVPGVEGKAGMAVILDPDWSLAQVENLNELFRQVRSELPTYAMPLFVRLTEDLDTTGTFKLPKARFVREGYDITQLHDPIFMLDPDTRQYVSFDQSKHRQLCEGTMQV